MGLARVGSMIGRILWGAVSDLLLRSRRIIVLVIVGALSSLAFFGTAFIGEGTPFWFIGVVAFVLGLTVLSWRTVFVVLVGELAAPGLVGTVMGATSTIASIGSLIGTPLFGVMVDATDSYAFAWTTTAIVALASTMLLLLLGRDPRKEAAQT